MFHPVLGQLIKRFALAGNATSTDLDRWADDDGREASLVILACGTNEMRLARALCEDAAHRSQKAEARQWDEFFSTMIRLPQILEHHQAMHAEYIETEVPGFRYVDQSVIVDDGPPTRLSEWIRADGGNRAIGVNYVVADYGVGKSSFCLNYVKHAMPDTGRRGAVPLLFNLIDMSGRSITDFVETRLRKDYGLELSFEHFADLCRLGVFVPVFDAFDQMVHDDQEGSLRIEENHRDLMELRSSVSPMFVTCRLDFFERHVRRLRTDCETGASAAFGVAALRRFDDGDVKDALGERTELAALLADPANQAVLGGIHQRPLMLQVIVRHAPRFEGLVAKHREVFALGTHDNAQALTEYAVFDLIYEDWLNTPFVRLIDQEEANLLLRTIAAQMQLDGMNKPLPLATLKRSQRDPAVFDSELSTRGILEDLRRLPLLNPTMLRREEPRVAFRFNAYLEFLTARFVTEDLSSGHNHGRELVQQKPLTWETRQMIAPNLRVDEHGDVMRKLVERTTGLAFFDVRFEGSNAVTLILDCAQHARIPPRERELWQNLLASLELAGVQLRRLDARDADLTGIDLSDADVRDADFSFAALRDASLSGAELEGASFREAGTVCAAVFASQPDEASHRWRLVAGTERGWIFVWDSTSPRPTRGQPHRDKITALCTSGSDSRTLSLSLDRLLVVSDADKPEVTLSYPLGLGGLQAMAMAPTGEIIVGGDSGTLIVWARPGQESYRLTCPMSRRPAAVSALAFDDHEDCLYAGTSEGGVVAFPHWRDGQAGTVWGPRAGGAVQALVAMPDASLLAVVHGHGAFVRRGRSAAPERLGDGTSVVSACYARGVDVIVWHDGRSVWRQSREPGSPAARIARLSADLGDALLSCSADGELVAAGGTQIVVWQDGNEGFERIRTKSMRMNCAGMILRGCSGLTLVQEKFLVSRGARL